MLPQRVGLSLLVLFGVVFLGLGFQILPRGGVLLFEFGNFVGELLFEFREFLLFLAEDLDQFIDLELRELGDSLDDLLFLVDGERNGAGQEL